MPKDLTGNCPGCKRVFEQLDTLLDAAINHEVETTGLDKRAARLHVLTAVESWWLDRTIVSFTSRARAVDAVNNCLVNVFREQGLNP